ncbi:MAG: molybdopterin-synthase adenylyltransferase MoeB [Lysobacterales bacterium]
MEIAVAAAHRAQAEGALLIDIREDHERIGGFPSGSRHLPMSAGFADSVRSLSPALPLLLICASGVRSLHAAVAFREAGFADAVSVAGGLHAWRAAGLPMQFPGADDPALGERYSRHWRLPEVGVAGQRRLLQSRVLLVGAGGLGSPIALYLAAAGVGHLCVADDDRIERSNLQRQIIHRDADVGRAKVASARAAIAALNPEIEVLAVDERVVEGNVERLVADSDLVVDGADNFATRYLINAACRKHRKPWVYGAVQRFEGQVSVFAPHTEPGVAPCYRCLFPAAPGPGEAPNCAEAGVLGVLPGIIGLLQANEAIKLLLGIGTPLIGRLLCFEGLAGQFRELRLRADPDCPECGLGTRG